MPIKGFWTYPITKDYNPPDEYGIDFGTPYHSPIHAPFGGIVEYAGNTRWGDGSSSGGLVVLRSFLPGSRIPVGQYFLHLDTINVQKGKLVQPGELIGLSGGQNSGGSMPASPKWSTGPHTEWGFNAPFLPVKYGDNFNPHGALNIIKNGDLGKLISDTASNVVNNVVSGVTSDILQPLIEPIMTVFIGLVAVGLVASGFFVMSL